MMGKLWPSLYYPMGQCTCFVSGLWAKDNVSNLNSVCRIIQNEVLAHWQRTEVKRKVQIHLTPFQHLVFLVDVLKEQGKFKISENPKRVHSRGKSWQLAQSILFSLSLPTQFCVSLPAACLLALCLCLLCFYDHSSDPSPLQSCWCQHSWGALRGLEFLPLTWLQALFLCVFTWEVKAVLCMHFLLVHIHRVWTCVCFGLAPLLASQLRPFERRHVYEIYMYIHVSYGVISWTGLYVPIFYSTYTLKVPCTTCLIHPFMPIHTTTFFYA